MNRLTHKDKDGKWYIDNRNYDAADRLAAYEEAEEQGRLIVLPADPQELADVAQEILSRACRLQREAEAALGGDGDG